MNLHKILKFLIHNIDINTDYLYEDNSDGKGPILTWLSKTIKQPTQSELDNAWVQVQALEKAEAIKKQKKIDIDKLATLSDQLNLLATTLDVVVGRVENIDPTLSVDPTIVNSRKILSGIQAILIK